MSNSLESSLQEPITLAEYLFERLKQAGIKSIHGVPGDYNLVALDYITKAGLRWVGDCNELNAGYAADGYARVNGLSALVTTFGVGELSAINALAGAYSEYVPIVHIVGCPSTTNQRDGMLLHHTLGNGDFNVFKNMSSAISVSVVDLGVAAQHGGGVGGAATVQQLIDEAITKCWVASRPVYVWLPTDVVERKVEGARLKSQPLELRYKPNDEEAEEYVTGVVLDHLKRSERAIVLVDACATRHRALPMVRDFIAASGLPVVTSPMGKGSIDEDLPTYSGIYAGSASHPEVKQRVEDSDLVLTIGSIKSDFNTSGFTYRVSQLHSIDFHSYHVKVKYSEYPGVRMNGVLERLAKRISAEKVKLNIVPGPKIDIAAVPEDKDDKSSQTITHAWLWPRFGQWVESGDIIVTETGTSNFGIMETRFPKNVMAINQYLWGSIGYATGAVQGAALAAQEGGGGAKRRTMLWTGDGSLQLTAQAIATMLRNDLAPILFVICNKGYTIERFIHGMDAAYNDVQEWRYKDLASVFGARQGQSKSYTVKTKDEFEQLLGDAEFKDGQSKVLRIVEVVMPYDDAPKLMIATSEAAAKNNSKQ